MGVTHTTTVINVADHELGVAWYSDLFGREPDRRPMEGSAEWQLTATSSVMAYADNAAAGGTTLILGVDDIGAEAAALYEREIVLEPYTVASGQFRLAELDDPSGNTVTFAQTLKDGKGRLLDCRRRREQPGAALPARLGVARREGGEVARVRCGPGLDRRPGRERNARQDRREHPQRVLAADRLLDGPVARSTFGIRRPAGAHPQVRVA
jgi:hypothetical protein